MRRGALADGLAAKAGANQGCRAAAAVGCRKGVAARLPQKPAEAGRSWGAEAVASRYWQKAQLPGPDCGRRCSD